MGRFFILGLILVFGLSGCMEEERVSSVKLQVGEIQPADSGGQDLGVITVDTDITDTADTSDAEVAMEDVADVGTEIEGLDTDDVATADEVSGSTDTFDADSAAEEIADTDISDAEDVIIAIDVTEIQDSQDVLEINEDVDTASEIAEDVSVVAEDVADVDVDVAGDDEVSGSTDTFDADSAAEEVADSDAQTDVEQDIPPDAPPDVISEDVEIDVPPPDPCLTLNCDDKNPCTLDSCSKTLGCSNAPTVVMCEDGNVCTVGDVCVSGTCTAGAPTKCNDGNLCTSDSCDPKFGCLFAANSLACEDGDICTEGEKCSSGSCTAGKAKNCSDGNECTSDSCDSAKGCVNMPMAVVCDDGNKCTEGDACSGGTCLSGATKTCDDGNACTSNVCDAVKGCANASNWVLYDWKDAKLAPNWTLGGNMEVTCNLLNAFKTKCVLWVPQGAPANTTSFAELDLDKVRASYKMGDGDLRIQFWWARFQFENNMDSMMSFVADIISKVIASVNLDGATGTMNLQEFVVPKAGTLLRFQLTLTEKPLLTGPAVWGKVLIAPVGCTPPATP